MCVFTLNIRFDKTNLPNTWSGHPVHAGLIVPLAIKPSAIHLSGMDEWLKILACNYSLFAFDFLPKIPISA
jgi:hypothetical protein